MFGNNEEIGGGDRAVGADEAGAGDKAVRASGQLRDVAREISPLVQAGDTPIRALRRARKPYDYVPERRRHGLGGGDPQVPGREVPRPAGGFGGERVGVVRGEDACRGVGGDAAAPEHGVASGEDGEVGGGHGGAWGEREGGSVDGEPEDGGEEVRQELLAAAAGVARARADGGEGRVSDPRIRRSR